MDWEQNITKPLPHSWPCRWAVELDVKHPVSWVRISPKEFFSRPSWPTSADVKIWSYVMPHTMPGMDYRPFLEFLFNSGSSMCLDIRVRCTEAPPQVRNILQWEHLTPSNAPLPHSSCERREHFCSLDWHAWHERRVPGAHLPRSLLRKMPAMTQNRST